MFGLPLDTWIRLGVWPHDLLSLWRETQPAREFTFYNWVKNFSSIARRAVSRVTQAACMLTDIEP